MSEDAFDAFVLFSSFEGCCTSLRVPTDTEFAQVEFGLVEIQNTLSKAWFAYAVYKLLYFFYANVRFYVHVFGIVKWSGVVEEELFITSLIFRIRTCSVVVIDQKHNIPMGCKLPSVYLIQNSRRGESVAYNYWNHFLLPLIKNVCK